MCIIFDLSKQKAMTASKTLSATSVKVLNSLTASMFEKRMDCKDLDHVSFVVKSDYCLGILSTKLDYIKKDNCFFAVNKGEILFTLMFKNENGTFQVYEISNEGLNKIEASV